MAALGQKWPLTLNTRPGSFFALKGLDKADVPYQMLLEMTGQPRRAQVSFPGPAFLLPPLPSPLLTPTPPTPVSISEFQTNRILAAP